CFFFSSRRRHTRSKRDWSSDVCSSDLSSAARARPLDEFAEITMFEKGPNVSFSNCSLPYHLSGVIPDADSIVLMTPEQFKNQYRSEERRVGKKSRSYVTKET